MASFVALQLLNHAIQVRSDDEMFSGAIAVEARASPVDVDTGVIDVSFAHPDTGEEVDAAVLARTYVSRAHDGTVQIEVSRRDARDVRLVGETRGYLDEAPFLAVLLAAPLLSWVLRAAHIRRLRRLMGGPATSYSMLAAAVPPGLLQRRWRIALYPLDAEPGSPPVGTVELIWLPLRPAGAFPVEVKGSPRPFALIALRAGEEVLWPRGHTQGIRSSHPRPAASGAFVADPAARQPVPPARRPSLWPSRLLRLGGLVALAAFLWLGQSATWRSERALERSRPAIGTSLGTAGESGTIAPADAVVFPLDGGTVRTRLRPGDEPMTRGAQVALRYSVDDPTLVWSASRRGPPDIGTDVSISFTLVAAMGGLVLGGVARRSELERLGAWEIARTGRVELGSLPPPFDRRTPPAPS